MIDKLIEYSGILAAMVLTYLTAWVFGPSLKNFILFMTGGLAGVIIRYYLERNTHDK